MASPLLHFLIHARSAVLRPPSSPPPTPLTLVLGNHSCDLDSFISATIYSFFHSRPSQASHPPRLHIPILNLPSTSSGELWRLRPEFATALRLALTAQGERETEQAGDTDTRLLDNLVTISDIRATPSSPLNHLFSKSAICKKPASTQRTSVILVDHNAISIPLPELSPSEISSNLDIVGCIDHHIDESTVPATASPRIIRTGIGSCTSLVVQYLRDEGFWQNALKPGSRSSEDGAIATVELATLCLASILIDTANLSAKGKVSDTDREIVSFLEDIVNRYHQLDSSLSSTPQTQATSETLWDRSSFYETLSSSKAHSLSLLKLPEILERDYKSWCEKTTTSGNKLNLGIASVVKPVTWLIKKADPSSAEVLVDAMREFATSGQRDALDIFAVMTTSTSDEGQGHGQFQRELLVLGTGSLRQETRKALRRFEETATAELGLVEWREDGELVDLLTRDDGVVGRIWWQRDIGKSRKQVAPLLREAMRSL
jgi:exopolyphosphatase